ncbi:hypothetical protein HYW59_04195 [Candidatus Kaiserbacteria bacterium]|nr:hypothetical protein [Candidatus Kaiserbacteria bacterium]
MREAEGLHSRARQAPEGVRGANTPEENRTGSQDITEGDALDRAFQDFLYAARMKKVPRERAAAQVEVNLNPVDRGTFRATVDEYKPVLDALDEYDQAARKGARQPDARGWAVQKHRLTEAGIAEFDRLRGAELEVAQGEPLGVEYRRRSQDISMPAPIAGPAAVERIPRSPGGERVSRRRESDSGTSAWRQQRRRAAGEKREIDDRAEPNGNENRNGYEADQVEIMQPKNLRSTPPLTPFAVVSEGEMEAARRLGPPLQDFLELAVERGVPMGEAVQRVTANMNDPQREEFIAGLVEATNLERDVLLDRGRRMDPRGAGSAEVQAADTGTPRNVEAPVTQSLYEAQAQPARDRDKLVEYKRFMNARYSIDPETGNAKIMFRDGRKIEVEDGRSLKFVNKRGETRRMVFDAGSGEFIDRDRYERVVRTDTARSEESSAQRRDTEASPAEEPKATLESFRRIKSPDPKEFKQIGDELLADTSARFAEGSKLLAEIAAKEKPEKLVQAIQEQLPKIAEVDRRGFERIKLRTNILASFEKGEYKNWGASITALGRRFGIRAEIFDRIADEKDAKARRAAFRVEIESSLGALGRLANFLTRSLYSRLRARNFDATSQALYKRAENTLNNYRRDVGTELGTVIGRNRTLREFFSALLKPKKEEVVENAENTDSAKLAA